MKLNKNEKRTLKMLLTDARMSDSEISAELKISSQAVGKMRRKLEQSVILSYGLKLDYAKFGIRTFAISLAKLTQAGLHEGELEVEQKLLSDPHIINVYRLPGGSSTHIIMYGFCDIAQMDNYFHSAQKKNELHKFIDNRELFTFSHNSLIKQDSAQLFCKHIDSMDTDFQ